MFLRQLPRKPLSAPNLRSVRTSRPNVTSNILRHSRPRFSSTAADPTKAQRRLSKLLDRLPRFLHPYTSGLRNAPVSHIIAFLILHEITAVVPLVGLAGLFHWANWLPEGWSEVKAVREGVERFGRYFGRKGWFGFTPEGSAHDEGIKSREDESGRGAGEEHEGGQVLIEETERKWGVGERGSRILAEVATAYAVTKVLLPVRIIFSVWGTPWFARVYVARVGGLFGKGKVKGDVSHSGAAGTGATAGGAIGKAGKGA